MSVAAAPQPTADDRRDRSEPITVEARPVDRSGDTGDDGSSLPDDIAAAIRSVVASAGRLGRSSGGSVAEAVDGTARTLVRRVVDTAVAHPRAITTPRALEDALRRSVTPALAGGTATAMAMKLARRLRPLRAVARRTPSWLVVASAPALYSSITRGVDELTVVASYLTHQVRATGRRPDPEKVRRATVQVLTGAPVDPAVETRLGRLSVGWLRRGARAALPFASGVHTADPDRVAARAAAVDARRLALD